MSSPQMEQKLGKEIGRGGFGVVYLNKTDPKLCIKVSNKGRATNSCREWSNEYKKIMDIQKKLPPVNNNRKMVRIVIPTKFVETDARCYMEMPLIYRPDRVLDGPTIQALLGVATDRTIHTGRGEFIGLREIRELVSESDLEKACYELGVLMGLLHYVAKNDAYDIELVLGREHHTRKPRFYLIDFDLSNKIKSYDTQTIENMAWSIDAVSYFPRPSVDAKLYRLFRNGYNRIVPREIADQVFADYA